jgi:DNA-directed RNA polymerase I, II, and III subunit RPABC2
MASLRDDDDNYKSDDEQDFTQSYSIKKNVAMNNDVKDSDDEYDNDGEEVEDNDDEEEDEDYDDDEEENDETLFGTVEKTSKPTGSIQNKFDNFISDDEDEDDEDDELHEDDNYLQKFNEQMKHNNVVENHPELIVHNNDEIDALTKITRDENGIIIDPFHRTVPFLTKYEKARILGEASKQIECGRKPFIEVEEGIIDAYLIACKELETKRLPYIIRRPLCNGSCEYWKLSDLEIL